MSNGDAPPLRMAAADGGICPPASWISPGASAPSCWTMLSAEPPMNSPSRAFMSLRARRRFLNHPIGVVLPRSFTWYGTKARGPGRRPMGPSSHLGLAARDNQQPVALLEQPVARGIDEIVLVRAGHGDQQAVELLLELGEGVLERRPGQRPGDREPVELVAAGECQEIVQN